MSIAVALGDLAATISQYGQHAYVITTGPDLRPRISHSRVTCEGTRLMCSVGRSTLTNAAERGHVVVVWPPSADDQLTLIVDGTGAVDGDALEVTASAAVLHRRPAE